MHSYIKPFENVYVLYDTIFTGNVLLSRPPNFQAFFIKYLYNVLLEHLHCGELANNWYRKVQVTSKNMVNPTRKSEKKVSEA